MATESIETVLARMEERLIAHQRSTEVFQDHIREKVDAIAVQTTETNGRVNEIEHKRLPKLEHWKSRWSGVVITLSAIATAATLIIGTYELFIRN